MTNTASATVSEVTNVRVPSDGKTAIFTFSTIEAPFTLTVPVQALDKLMLAASHAAGAIQDVKTGDQSVRRTFQTESIDLYWVKNREALVLEVGIVGGWKGCFDLPLEKARDLAALFQKVVVASNLESPSTTRQ